MDIFSRLDGKLAILNLKGDFSSGAIAEFQDVLQGIQKQGATVILFEFSEVEILTSQAVGAIIRFSKSYGLTGGEIYFCNIPDHINEILVILNLTHQLLEG